MSYLLLFILVREVFTIYIYPDNLRAKPKLWLWELRDVAVIGIGFLLSVLALANGAGMLLMILTVLFAFLSIRMEGASIHPAAYGNRPAHRTRPENGQR